MVNSNFYSRIKKGFQQILLDAGWNPIIELKGAYLFSVSKGCPDVTIEKRIDMVSEVIKLNTANKNARMRFVYGAIRSSKDKKHDYLRILPLLLSKLLYKAKKGQGKDIISLHYDYRSDIRPDEIYDVVKNQIERKGYTIFEKIVCSRSGFQTVGILYADIIGYLCGKIDTISNDSELFEKIPKELYESSGKIKKLKSSTKLVRLIKNLDLYKIKLKR